MLRSAKTLRESIEQVRREVAAMPAWLREIYARNREIEQWERDARAVGDAAGVARAREARIIVSGSSEGP